MQKRQPRPAPGAEIAAEAELDAREQAVEDVAADVGRTGQNHRLVGGEGPTILGAMNCIRRAITAPKPTPMAMAYRRILSTRSYLPAPMFWAPSADTVESMELGTRKRSAMP